MKKRIQILCLFSILFPVLTNAELPPKVEGENFQRVEDKDFQDCQNFRIPAIRSEETKKVIQKEINRTTCFYKVFFMLREGGGKRDLIMSVETDNITGKTVTSYMNDIEADLTL